MEYMNGPSLKRVTLQKAIFYSYFTSRLLVSTFA